MFPKHITLTDGQKILIRKADIKDASEILEFTDRVGEETDYLSHGPGELGLTLRDQQKLIDRSVKIGNWLILIAEMNEQIVGTLNFISGTRPRITHTGIFGVTVLKEHWGLGIGRGLVKSLVEWARTAKIRKVNLKVRPDNTRAMDMYRKLGFVEEGRITREFYINGKYYDNILMGLELD